MVDVIIPTKSNMDGLQRLVNQLKTDPAIDSIIVVADGEEAHRRVEAHNIHTIDRVILVQVELGVGIHVMWNLGMDLASRGNHVCFINDDVSIGPDCMSIMAQVLEEYPEVGLLTPNSTGQDLPDFSETAGFAGFCMMLASNLCPQFRFDERMKWWYGDNDIIMWVHSVGRKTGYTGRTVCGENQSFTINNDPPADFHRLIEEDARLFREKWGQ